MKYVTKTSIALTMVVPTVITAIASAAWWTPQEWELGPMILLITVVVGSWLWAAGFVYKQYVAQPTFSAFGAHVWGYEVPIMTPSELRTAIHFFCWHFRGQDDFYKLSKMFKGARLEFTAEKPWLGLRRVEGMQRGSWIKCHYGLGFGYNAFFHECAHMVDEMVDGVPPDYHHMSLTVWEKVNELKRNWRKEHHEV